MIKLKFSNYLLYQRWRRSVGNITHRQLRSVSTGIIYVSY